MSSSAVAGDTGDGGVTPVHHGAIMDLRAALVEMGRWQRRCMDMEAALDEVGGAFVCRWGGGVGGG